MKTLIGVVLAVFVAVLLTTGFLLTKRHTQAEMQERAALQAELAAKTAALDQARVQQERAQQERERIAKLADEIGAQLAAQQTSTVVTATDAGQPPAPAGLAGGTNDAGGLGKMIAKMMEDPDTRKFIRQQQRMMMDQLYSPLVTKLNLTDAEATQFKDFMADNMMKAAEKSTALLGSSSENRAESLKGLAEEQKQFEEELKVFLGEERYSTYKDYQTTLGERAQLNMFRQQSASGPNAITDDQAEQLLSLIKVEKAAMPELMEMDKDETKLAALGSQEQIDKLIKAQEDLNQRVKARATEILRPGQMDTFSKFQTQQLDTLRLGMSMARKMFSE
jgi:hypothetical protein